MRGTRWRLAVGLALGFAGAEAATQPLGGQTPPVAGASAQSASAIPATFGAGRACATPDDSTGTSISGTFRGRADPIYSAGGAALRDLGYAVLETVPPRELMTAPSYSWPRGTEREPWHGTEHPGLEVFLFTRSTGDSTTVTVGARALCKVAGAGGGSPDSEVGRNLEGIATLTAMNALINRLRNPPRS